MRASMGVSIAKNAKGKICIGLICRSHGVMPISQMYCKDYSILISAMDSPVTLQ